LKELRGSGNHNDAYRQEIERSRGDLEIVQARIRICEESVDCGQETIARVQRVLHTLKDVQVMLSLTKDIENKLYSQREVAKKDRDAPIPTGGRSRYLVKR